MKNIIKTSALLVCGLTLLASCDDDRDNNPVLETPTTFTLNTPAYANANVDLATSTDLSFSWSQPAYGYPAIASYQIQVSPTNSWTKDVQAGDVDAAGLPVGDFKTFDTEYNVVKGTVTSDEMAKALEQIEHYEEGAVPESQTVYARIRAAYAGDTIYSNVVSFKVLPYYVMLADAAIDEWYMIGGCIGDGKWTNDPAAAGTSIIPLYTESGQEYNKETGVGTLTYTGYFPAGGEFKIIHSVGDNWANTQDVVCKDLVFRDGGDDPGNVTVAESGYYKIVLDPVARTCTMTKVDDPANNFSQMFIAGDYNKWAVDAAMHPVNTVDGVVNHDWYCDIEVTDAAGSGVKFLADPDWTNNWGDTGFPYGYGVKDGSNIPVKQGKYRVFFNDITGQYHFISQE